VLEQIFDSGAWINNLLSVTKTKILVEDRERGNLSERMKFIEEPIRLTAGDSSAVLPREIE